MLIILKEPIMHPETDVLAVNFNAFDTVNIHKVDINEFRLIIIQQFDGYQTDQSQSHIPIGFFDSYEKCLDLFQELIEALQSGVQVFDLRNNPHDNLKIV